MIVTYCVYLYVDLRRMLALYFVAAILTNSCWCEHLVDVWKPDRDFYLFLSKFGFQQTAKLERDITLGYVYGNISVFATSNSTGFFVLLFAIF